MFQADMNTHAQSWLSTRYVEEMGTICSYTGYKGDQIQVNKVAFLFFPLAKY